MKACWEQGWEQAPQGSGSSQLQHSPASLEHCLSYGCSVPQLPGQLGRSSSSIQQSQGGISCAVLSTRPVTVPMTSPAAAGAVWVALGCPGTGIAWTLLHSPIWLLLGHVLEGGTKASTNPSEPMLAPGNLGFPIFFLTCPTPHIVCLGQSWASWLCLWSIPQTLHWMDKQGGGYCGCSVLQASHGTISSL